MKITFFLNAQIRIEKSLKHENYLKRPTFRADHLQKRVREAHKIPVVLYLNSFRLSLKFYSLWVTLHYIWLSINFLMMFTLYSLQFTVYSIYKHKTRTRLWWVFFLICGYRGGVARESCTWFKNGANTTNCNFFWI